MLNTSEMINYQYIFTFNDGTTKELDIHLDPVTLDCMSIGRHATPEWARLEYAKCKNCPLDSSEFESCPVAVGLAEVTDIFKGMDSDEEVDVMVITNDKSTYQCASIQECVNSLLSIYMVTNGCPALENLKPMIRYHLPFTSLEEATYSATSMHLIGQYFRRKKDLEPDGELQRIAEIYENIKMVNNGMYQRLQNFSNDDAIINAIFDLYIFACAMAYYIEDSLGDIQHLLALYMGFMESKRHSLVRLISD